MKSHTLSPLGRVSLANGNVFSETKIDANLISVEHLQPHIETYQLDGNDKVNILIQYSCHCWTCGWDDIVHAQQIIFLDHNRPRAFDADRYNASINLSNLIKNLAENRIYVTRSDRNYGCYNATLSENSNYYTAYFTVKPKKGRFNGIRHKFILFVESAFAKPQPEPGMKTNLRAVIGKAREGKTVKYRR